MLVSLKFFFIARPDHMRNNKKKSRSLLQSVFNLFTGNLTDKQYILLRHYVKFHRVPNLKDPKLYNEMIAWRMLYDRKPLFNQVADKLAMREYAKSKGLQEYLPKLIFETSDPHQIPINLLPNAFVVKANHGSGMILLVPDKQQLDLKNLYKICNKWLSYDYYYRVREWQYHNLPRRIMVEEFIGGGPLAPVHYGIHCYDGEPRIIKVYVGRYTNQERKIWVDTSWNLQEYTSDSISAFMPPQPKRFEELLEVSRKFSAEFDYVRVDLYALPERVVFGEMTLTQGAGLTRYNPELEALLGSYWQ